MLRFFVIIRAADGSGPSVTFEQAAAELEALPRLFFEPDGSFVWTGQAHGAAWQVDGNLVDRGPALAYMELKGMCPAERLDDLLQAIGWPAAPLAFELPQRGAVLDEPAFRSLAASPVGAV